MLVVPEAKRRTGRHLQTWDETPVVPGSCIDFSIVLLDVGQTRLGSRSALSSSPPVLRWSKKNECAGFDLNIDGIGMKRSPIFALGPGHVIDVNRRVLPLDL